MEKPVKTIIYDNNDIESIKRAEKRKLMLENKGYRQIKTEQLSVDRWALIYKAPK